MSGVEKFQSSEAWRTNVKKLLLMERKPEIVEKQVSMAQSQRHSLYVGKDLENKIEQTKNKKTVQENVHDENINLSNTLKKSFQKTNTNILKPTTNIKETMNRYDDASDVSFEALEKMCEKTASDPNSTLFKYLNGGGEQKTNNVLVWEKTSDESFEALERMCEKTVSDPNSTVFQYLHSDRKQQILVEAKKRNADGLLLNELNEKDSLLMKINNYTILDDVEAPSRLWENTICGDTNLQTSPVKMVGLLRPSTIVEEAPDESANSDISYQVSFHTATKSVQGDVSSNVYESAHDSTNASNRCDDCNEYRYQELDGLDVDQIILTALVRNEQIQKNDEIEIISTLEKTNATIVKTTSCEGEQCYNSDNTSVNLIDFEKTFRPLCISASPHSSILAEDEDKEIQNLENFENKLEDDFESELASYNISDSSIIEIQSDDEDDEIENEKSIKNENFNNQKFLNKKAEINSESKCEMLSCNETDNESDKENLAEMHEPSETSMQFNDTIEEVEYMIKKGKEYMAAKSAVKITPEKSKNPLCSNNNNNNNNQVPKTHLSSPKKQPTIKHVSSSASKAVFPTCTTLLKNTPNKIAYSKSKPHDIDIRPFPKFDLFAKPQPHGHSKELTSKSQKFSHIVSPIGTYIKKTAKTPLMSSISCKNKNYFNSSAILELENESRIYQPLFQTDSNAGKAMTLPKLPGLPSDVKRPLPKKAYISSDYKHIVDERTPVIIPGGKKIQQYLENAMMPAVLRHEGKLKIPGAITNKPSFPLPSSSKLPLKISDINSTAKKSSDIPRSNNASLANLSLMSGDVSLYTIMDAHKF